MKELKWIVLGVLAIIWGSSFILIKKGLVGLTPIELGGIRMLSASIVMILLKGKQVITIPRYRYKYIVVSALLGMFIPAFLFAFAQTQIDSIISSIINATTPLLTFLIGVLFFGLLSERRQVFGVFVGFVGCGLLIFTGASFNIDQNYWFALLPLVACVMYAVNINWLKKYLSDLTPAQIAAANFVLLLPLSILVLLATDILGKVHIPEVQSSLLYTSILGIASTGLSSLLFYRLISISSPVFASSSTYLIPLVAFVWGVLDGERIYWGQFLGAIIILIGVYLSAKKK